MLRKLLMSAPALAFAVPFVAAQPSMARPLATPVEASLWGNDDDDDDDDNGDDTFQLTVCFQTQVAIDLDDRAYECGIEKGPSCLARCTPEAVAPLCDSGLALAARSNSCVADAIDTCERQCLSGGAAFCAPTDEMKVRGKHDDDDDDDDNFAAILDDDDDDHHGGDDVVFIDIETCIDLDLDLDNL
ncbi:MAG TPA: hypothetical protein VIK91_26505 [Nannocystis sp.]